MAVQQQTDNKSQTGPPTSTTIQQDYSTTKPTSHTKWYEPLVNDSIIQGANTAPIVHLMGSTTTSMGHNTPWRNNNNNNATQQTRLTFPQKCTC